MAKPKRGNVYQEARVLADLWNEEQRKVVITEALKPGPKRALMPALIYHNLMQQNQKVASRFLMDVVDATVRD